MVKNIKKCSTCQVLKSLDSFNKNKTKKDGLNTLCRDCSNKKSKRYYLLNKQMHIKKVAVYKSNHKAKVIASRLKINESEVQAILDASNSLCAICHRKTKLVVDHCHSSNKVRGLLCNSCNKGLGFFEDNVERLSSAIKYIEQ